MVIIGEVEWFMVARTTHETWKRGDEETLENVFMDFRFFSIIIQRRK